MPMRETPPPSPAPPPLSLLLPKLSPLSENAPRSNASWRSLAGNRALVRRGHAWWVLFAVRAPPSLRAPITIIRGCARANLREGCMYTSVAQCRATR